MSDQYVVPGDRDHPEWWTRQDEEILRGALAELGELPRPPYVEREPDRLVYVPLPRRRRWAREIGAWITLVAVTVLVLLLASWAGERPAPPICPGDPAGCADLQTVDPTTIPRPSSGPR